MMDDDFNQRQFERLGEMIGDGLHHESDSKWILKEYNKLMKILIPEVKERIKEARKDRNKIIDQQILKLLVDFKCSCGGALKQKRSGSRVCYCNKCNLRYKASVKK